LREGTWLASWQVVFTKEAQKDAKRISAAGLRRRVEELKAVKVLRMWTHYE
jgi:mRNA-degrading endonuclease RelE of RelBE toxin-antitoxin system